MKLSPLFPMDVDPVRIGLYCFVMKKHRVKWWSWWDGRQWCWTSSIGRELAVANKQFRSLTAYRSTVDIKGWRGVLK